MRDRETERERDSSRVLDQNDISQACYIVKIHHSGPEPMIYILYIYISRVSDQNGVSEAC